MSEIFDRINENAERVSARLAEETQIAMDIARLERERIAKARRVRACRQLLTRVGIAIGLILSLYLAAHFGLMSKGLATPIICAVFVWVSFWFGGWVQLSWYKRGLFE
jgi:hypothetical protein